MKSIQSFLDTIKGGRYGRDIKSAIHKALDALSANETELKQAVDGLEIGSGGFALETQSLEYTDCVYNGTAGIYVLSPNSNTEYRISCDTDTGSSAVRCPKLRINLPTDQPRFACRIILHHFSGFQADIGEALSGTEAFTKIGDDYVADTNSGTNEQDTIGISIWHDGQGYRYCCYRPGYAGNTSISEATAAANEAAKAANAARETVEGIIAGLEAGTGTGAKRSVYLDPVNGSDANDGLSWADPMKTIQAAISKYSAVPNLELSLSGGIYSGDIYIGNQCVKIYNLDSESIDATIYGKITVQYGTLILSDAASVISSETAISIENGGCLVASKSGITSTGSDTIPAILVSGNSTAFLNSCTFSARGQSSKILLSAENGSVVRTFACNYGGTASYGIIQAKMASKIVDDTTVMFPTQSNAISGSVIYRNGVQISPYVPPIVDRVTVYLNASTGSDANNGLSVDKPLATVASAFAKYVDYNNIRLQFAAGSYDIGTITAENKKIALVGASAANTTLNGRINLTSCTLTLSALTVVADGTTPIVTASTGSHVYGYRANFTSTGGAECLRVTTASQCYLDGSVFTTANDTDTVVRSSGGALVCLGYCTVPGVLRASTTGLINTVNGTIHDTAVESGGIIWVNGTRVAPVEDTGWITKTADFDETVNGNTVTTKVTVTYRKVGAVASMHAVVNRPKGAASIMLTTGGKLTVPTSCAPAYLYHIPETNVRGVQMTANGTTGDQTYFRFDFLTGAEQTDQTYMFDATYFVN